MKEQRGQQSLEEQLRAAAETFPYPPTPDIARAVRGRLRATPGGSRSLWSAQPQLVWATAVLLLFLVSLLAVPEVRAGIGVLFRIGAIRIVMPTPLPTPASTALPSPVSAAESPSPTAGPIPTRPPTVTPFPSVLNLAGETTFDEASRRFDLPIRLPADPADLGPPDRVFVQDLGGTAVILVWMDPAREERVRMSLHQLTNEVYGEKEIHSRRVLLETTVNDRPALWVRGPHFLHFRDPGGDEAPAPARLVDGNVLIWEDEAGITFRLEIRASLEDARRIAESVR